MCVPEIGGQERQASLGIFTISIPAKQCLNCKSVTKIVQARATTAPSSMQSNLSKQHIERAMNLTFVQPVALLIHEEGSL